MQSLGPKRLLTIREIPRACASSSSTLTSSSLIDVTILKFQCYSQVPAIVRLRYNTPRPSMGRYSWK